MPVAPQPQAAYQNPAGSAESRQGTAQAGGSQPARHGALALGMVRLLYRGYRLGLWFARMLRRRLTPAGLLVASCLIFTLGMGSDITRSQAYQNTALIAAFLLSGSLWTLFFRGRFTCERLLPRYATAGSPVRYQIRITNGTRAAQAGLDLIDEVAGPRHDFAEFASALLSTRKSRSFRASGRAGRPAPVSGMTPTRLETIEPAGTVHARLQLTPGRRGVLRFERVVIGRPDPLGLIRATQRVSAGGSLVVLPRRYRLPEWALPGARQYQQGGVVMASAIGESEEFVSLRDYRPGDPMSHIHWKSWARAGRPIVKEFQDEFFMRHAVVLDTFASADDAAAFEEAISVAASFAATVDTQESLLDLLFVGARAYCVTAGRGLAHSDQLLEVLAAVTPCPHHAFSTLEHAVLNHARCLSGCICIFVAWDERRRQLTRRLAALGLPLQVLVITDGSGAESPTPGDGAIDPDRFRVLRAGRIQEDLLGGRAS